jgi:hypothetical protein
VKHETVRPKRNRIAPGALFAIIFAAAVALAIAGSGSAGAQTAPANQGDPAVRGAAVQGETLTTTNGTWTGTAPITFRYRWLRCDTTGGGVNGVNCTTIAGETRNTYILRRADVGHRIRSRVIASNADGTASANSNATPTVKASSTAGRPVNQTPPTISGTAQQGQTLTANPGTWTGGQPITYAYQWRRCDQTGGSCSDISGATSKTYVLTAADVANTVRVRVTAKNSLGSRAATSTPTAVVSKADAPVGTAVSISEVSLPNRLQIDQYTFQPNRLRKHGRVIARFHVSDSRNHSVVGALVFVEGVPLGQTAPSHAEKPTGADGWVTFTIRATSRLQLKGSNRFAFFLRARKAGENPLAGVTARRLVAVRLG